VKLTEKEMELIEILEKDARLPIDTIAKMINLSVEETEETIKKLEDEKVIVRYISIIDWAKIEEHSGVKAMIDVKVTPQRGVGFNEIAQRIYRFEEVTSVYLMSGAYDLSVIIEGNSMNDIARFVFEKLSTLDSVVSTTTHFILRTYKHDGTIFEPETKDKRIVVSP
jgi:DNA-binding Lrp family transcriptional regulator